MKTIILFCSCMIFTLSALPQSPGYEKKIRKVLAEQEQNWNNGNIDAFMQGYWKSDSLLFVGSAGPQYGWQNTLDRYKRTYDSPEKMGTLKFEILRMQPLGKKDVFVLGKWHLTRSVGDVGGYFTLVFRKINGVWLIISDHTS